jgi:hypothetical protein
LFHEAPTSITASFDGALEVIRALEEVGIGKVVMRV